MRISVENPHGYIRSNITIKEDGEIKMDILGDENDIVMNKFKNPLISQIRMDFTGLRFDVFLKDEKPIKIIINPDEDPIVRVYY